MILLNNDLKMGVDNHSLSLMPISSSLPTAKIFCQVLNETRASLTKSHKQSCTLSIALTRMEIGSHGLDMYLSMKVMKVYSGM